MMVFVWLLLLARSMPPWQVATTMFGEIPLTFWMSAEGYQKLTSLCPCMVWMMKAVSDTKKAMFAGGAIEETLECADACLD